VAPARRSKSALAKVRSHVLDDGTVVHSFQTLMKDLGSIVRNVCRRKEAAPSEATFEITTTPSVLQARAFALLRTIRV